MSATSTRSQSRRAVQIVRANQLITIRDLARRLRCSQAVALDACESDGLNINIGVRVGGSLGCLIGEHESIGDYSVEDLSV